MSLISSYFLARSWPIFGDELVTSFLQPTSPTPIFCKRVFVTRGGHTINAGYDLARHLGRKEKILTSPAGHQQKSSPQQGFLRPQRSETYNPCTLGSSCGDPQCASFFRGHDVRRRFSTRLNSK